MRPLTLAVRGSIGVLFVALLLPLMTGRVFVLDDLAAFHLPVRYLYQQALLNGDSILWTPSLYSGFYLFGEGQAGMSHPLHWLLYRLLPLGPAFNLEIVISYVALLVGGALLLRRLMFAAPVAWFGAMTFAFSGSTLLHFMHVNAVAVVAHLPWLLLCTDVLLTSEQPRARAAAMAGIAALLASQLLLGHPQYVCICWIVIGLQVLWMRAGRHPWQGLGLLLLAITLGSAMAAVQLLPTLDVLRGSLHSNLSSDLQFQVSLSPSALLLFFSPRAVQVDYLHEFASYNGAFCSVALCWLALRRGATTRSHLTLALLGLLVVGVLLALGSSGGLYPLLAHLPGFNAFRAPGRHIVIAHFALSGLAAIALEDLWSLHQRGDILPIARVRALALVPLLAVVITMKASGPPAAGIVLNPWFWVAMLLGVTTLVLLSSQGHQWTLPVLVIVAALDQGIWGFAYIYGPHGSGVATIASAIDETSSPAQAAPGDRLFQPLREIDRGNLMVLRHFNRSNGYAGLMPSTALDPTDPVAQRIGGVAWRESNGTWIGVDDPMPRARLVAAALRSSDVRHSSHTVSIEQSAIVTGEVGRLDGAPGTVHVVKDRPGMLMLDTSATGRQLLVTTERFHNGWRASIDGTPATTISVYGDYLGTVVPAGAHHVQLHFAPDSAWWGARLSIVGIAATLCLTGLLAWTPRRRSADTQPM